MQGETTQPAAPSTPAEGEQQATEQTPGVEVESEGEQAQTTEATDAKPEPEKAETEPKERKKPSYADRLKRRIATIAAEATELARQNEEMSRRLSQAGTSREGRPGIDREPTEQDFPNDYMAFDRARIAWDAKQAVRSEINRERMRSVDVAAAQIREERLEAYQEGLEVARERIPDFDKVMRAAQGSMVAPQVEQEIVASEKGPLLAYFLAQNPDKLHDLNAMNGAELAREIGRLEGRVHLPKPNTATRASPPLTTPKGGAAAPFNPETASMDEYVRVMNERERKHQGLA